MTESPKENEAATLKMSSKPEEAPTSEKSKSRKSIIKSKKKKKKRSSSSNSNVSLLELGDDSASLHDENANKYRQPPLSGASTTDCSSGADASTELRDEKAQYRRRRQSGASISSGDDASTELRDEKAQYRRRRQSGASTSSGDDASTELRDEKAQYRRRRQSGASTSSGDDASTELRDEKAQYRHKNRGSNSTESQHQTAENQKMQTVKPADLDRVGAYRVVITTAHVTQVPDAKNKQTHSPQQQNCNQGNKVDDDNEGSSYFDEEEAQGWAQGWAQEKAESDKRTKAKCNFRIIASTFLVLVLAVLVAVFFIAGGSGSSSSSSTTTQGACITDGTCDPGTIACQADEICRENQSHIAAWEATGCLGTIDCSTDFTPNEMSRNETIREACTSLAAATQECHDNIICKRRKSHVQYVLNSDEFGVNSCEATISETTAATTLPTMI